MYYIAIGLNPHPTNRRASQPVTARGLHGLLFHILEKADPEAATWLHKHPPPKPFSLQPFYAQDGRLMGLRYGALTEDCAVSLIRAWQTAQRESTSLALGRDRTYRIRTIEVIPSDDFTALAQREAPAHRNTQILHFITPTDFKQGPGSLPLPLPGNVFGTPFRLWQKYAPVALPSGWLDWCKENVFVTQHDIQTKTVPLNLRHCFTGFVGTVSFEAKRGSGEYLRIWHALGAFATFCGIGRKTTMGMGAVEQIG